MAKWRNIFAFRFSLFFYGGLSLILPPQPRDVSSVGLEHRLDRAGVVGSNPSHPTELEVSVSSQKQ